MVYRHLDATFPKYMVREHGTHVMYGTILSLNPLLIVVLVPLFSPFAIYVNAYSQITLGTFLSAISPIFLAFSSSIKNAIFFVVVLSVGEAIWSPRLYEYSLTFVPKGREGTYTSLASAPMFFAKLLSGVMSGVLLEKFCPAEGPRFSTHMWLIITVMSIVSPITLFLFRSCIEIVKKDKAN